MSGARYASTNSSIEFIPIKPSVARASGAPGSYAGHSRVPSPDRGHPLPQADAVFDDATALDTAVDMLDPQPTLVQGLVGQVLLQRQLLAAGFLGRHEDVHLGSVKARKPRSCNNRLPAGKG